MTQLEIEEINHLLQKVIPIDYYKQISKCREVQIGGSEMKKFSNKKIFAVIVLSFFSLSFFSMILPLGPKLPPVEFTQTFENT